MGTTDLTDLEADLRVHMKDAFPKTDEDHFDDRSLQELIEDAATNLDDFEGSAFLSEEQIEFLDGAVKALLKSEKDLETYLAR
jgi:hypothetical protein